MFFPSYLVAAAKPLGWINRRVRWLERYLETPLTDRDYAALRVACERSGCRFGKFYHWYLQKKVTSSIWRTISKEETLRMAASLDRSDYTELHAALERPQGLLLALPHHGLYANSSISMTERIRLNRDIYIFYGDPATHPGNEVFDDLSKRLWLDDPNSRVRVLYDNRAGMVSALRALSSGAAVIIMPDVFKNEIDTFQIPFCGRAMNIMLGTAVLARKTNAAILPVVCEPSGSGMDFRTRFGPLIQAEQPFQDEVGVDVDLLNYRTMLRVFRFYESIMDENVIYWQFARQLYAHDIEMPILRRESVLPAAEALVADARLHVPAAFLPKDVEILSGV